MSLEYAVITKQVSAELEEKRSRFMAFLSPIDSREQALAYLDEIKSRYPEARHHCWAYILGSSNQPINQAFSDDGEPSGTAGKPILNVLTQRGVGDCIAVVVRYFGGIKLGAGGLVRAYGASVSKAVDLAELDVKKPQMAIEIRFDFAIEGLVRRTLEEFGGTIRDANYSSCVALIIQLDASKVGEFKRLVTNLSGGKLSIDNMEAG